MINMFSLRTIIDDILLIVRNNNISESEDLSRAQIAAWILAYKASILKERKDKEKDSEDVEEDSSLTELIETKGPLELIYVDDLDESHQFRRRTKKKIPMLLDNDPKNLFVVEDHEGCPIQFMNHNRRHFHDFRKYTHDELCYWYENGYIFIKGLGDCGRLLNIWITGLFSGEDDLDEDMDEDDIKIPGWMVPDIKKLIMNNELAFMLNRISDDDNNSTLDGIKPQAQAVTPNEK